MTTQDQDPNQDDSAQDVTETAEDFLNEDDDPIIAEMKEAEAEIAAAEKSSQQGEEGEPEAPEGEQGEPEEKPQEEGSQEEQEEKPEGEAKGSEGEQEPIMIPKARFDQVNSELQAMKSQLSYMQGIIDTQGTMAKPVQQEENQVEEKSFEDRINDTQDKVLELAQKYEDGDISLVDFEKERFALQNEIRTLEDERITAQIEGVKQETSQAVSASSAQNQINSEAVRLQEDHPYIAKIDKLPEAIRDGVWKQIDSEAVANLAQRGVNVNDTSVETKLAIVREKAALTNKYGPQYTGVKIEGGQQTGQQGAPAGEGKKPSETAAQRAAKLELSEQQPPAAGNVGASERKELTEADIENMSEDEIADMLETAPQIVLKAAGIPNR